MAIFLTEDSKILVQGITGSEGTKHTIRMLSSHANIVAGVTPGKGGQTVTAEGRDIPVFGSCQEAVAATGADVSVVFVPPRFAKAAVVEAVDAAIPLVVVITEGIPVHDTAAFYQYAADSGTTRIIGPNCPGLISPGKSNAGIIPGTITKAGRIGFSEATTSPSRSSAMSPASPHPKARRWGTPAPSSPAPRAPPRRRRKPSRPSASRSARRRRRPHG